MSFDILLLNKGKTEAKDGFFKPELRVSFPRRVSPTALLSRAPGRNQLPRQKNIPVFLFYFLSTFDQYSALKRSSKNTVCSPLIQFIFSNVEMVKFKAVAQMPPIFIIRSFLRRTEQVECSKKTDRLSMCTLWQDLCLKGILFHLHFKMHCCFYNCPSREYIWLKKKK